MIVIDVSLAFDGLEQPLRLIVQSNTVVQGINIPTGKTYNLIGIVQPLDLRNLKIVPTEQIEYSTQMVHIRRSILQQNNITLTLLNSLTFQIIFNNASYKTKGKWLYNDYGYAQVDAIQTAK